MAVITDYPSLQAAIANHAWKGADADYVAAVPLFIQLAEVYLQQKLRHRKMMASVDLTPDVNFKITLPSDFLEIESVTALTSPFQPLEPITPEMADQLYPTRPASWPYHYKIVGDSVEIMPGNAANVRLRYIQAIPSLRFGTTNWLLDAMPAIYLYAALAEGAAFLKDAEELPRWVAMRDAAINAFMAANEVGMWNGARPMIASVLP